MNEDTRNYFEDKIRSLEGCITRIALTRDNRELEQMYSYGLAYLHMMLTVKREDLKNDK